MNQKLSLPVKIGITVICTFFAVVAVDCIVGFLIGGRFLNLLTVFIPLSILSGIGCIRFLYGKERFKEKNKPWTPIVIASFILLLIYAGVYSVLNTLSASREYKEYKSEVTYVSNIRGELFWETVEFTDSEGNKAETLNFYMDPNGYEEGEIINVTERLGGFGYPVYRIQELNDLR